MKSIIPKTCKGPVTRAVLGATTAIAILATCLPVTTGIAAESVTATAPQACGVSAEDRAWLDRSVTAWRNRLSRLGPPGGIRRRTAIIFDSQCMLTSDDAMQSAGPVTWTASPHDGMVTLPDGQRMPAGVTSFAGGDNQTGFFVMSTPSVWQQGGVPGGPMGLETLMTAVMLHEGSHILQLNTYMQRITDLSLRNALPDSFSDDSIQKRFESEPEFKASVERETDLLFSAAAAPDDATARQLAKAARKLIAERQSRWFTGQDAYLAEAEDVFLTLEGSGQWQGFEWLISSDGAALAPDAAMSGFGRRSKWWSQKEGLALFLVVDRLYGPAWRGDVFGPGTLTGLQWLDSALVKS